MSVPLRPDDPAYWMLEKGRAELDGPVGEAEGWVSKTTVYADGCYICEDPEFALMGLPLCYPCAVVIDGVECGAHTPADDVECDEGHDAQEWHESKGESY